MPTQNQKQIKVENGGEKIMVYKNIPKNINTMPYHISHRDTAMLSIVFSRCDKRDKRNNNEQQTHENRRHDGITNTKKICRSHEPTTGGDDRSKTKKTGKFRGRRRIGR